MKDKAEFAVNILLEYAKENGINGRDTTDLSPLESWLISRLYNVVGQREQLHVENACKCENKKSFNRLQCPNCKPL